MANTATKDKPAAPKAAPRPSAVLAIDLTKAVDETKLDEAPTRRTQWDSVLDQVYELTEAGEVPRNDDGSLKFIPIGSYKEAQGAKAQVKAFIKKKLDQTYEFRVSGSTLYVRVRVTPDAAA